MTNMWTVIRYELRQQFRRKAYLFTTFVLPVLVVVGFLGYQAIKDWRASDDDAAQDSLTESVNSGIGKVIGYVDHTAEGLFPAPESYPSVKCTVEPGEQSALVDGGAATRAAIIKRIGSPYCRQDVIFAYDSFEAGKDALENDAIDVLYVFEPDFAASGDISVYVAKMAIDAPETETLIRDYILRTQLYRLGDAEFETLYLRLRDPAFVGVQRVTETGETETDNVDKNMILIYGFGLTTMLGILWGGGYLMQSVVQEKESRIVEIMLSSVQPTALLAGKTLAMAVVAVLQLVFYLGAFIIILTQGGDIITAVQDFDVEPGLLALVVGYFALGFLLFGSLMAAIGAVSTSVRESQNFVVFITLPAMVPFFFLPIFAQNPDGTMPRVFSFIPITTPLAMVMRVTISDVPIGEIVLSIVLLIAGVAGAMWFAGRLFRVNTLLMGKMPRLKDIPKLLRG